MRRALFLAGFLMATTVDAAADVTEDPSLDHAWISPTAATQPAGTVSVTDVGIVVVALTYGVTDSLQLTAIGMPPLGSDAPSFGLLSGKLSTPLGEGVRVAGSLAVAVGNDGEVGTLAVGGAGAALSLCTDGPCASLLSVYLLAGFPLSNHDDDALALAFGASLLQRLGSHVKVVLDVTSAAALGADDGARPPGMLVTYGVRLFGTAYAFDVGLARPISFEEEDYARPGGIGVFWFFGFPVAAFTYRWGP